MPELLEVEHYRRLAEGIVGRQVADVVVCDPHCLRGGLAPRAFRRALVGSTFDASRRIGKLLLLDGTGPTLGIRFGMTGSLVLDEQVAIERLLYGPSTLEEKWVRFRLQLADGGALLLHDPRRFGRVELDPDESLLGPDATAVTTAQLRHLLAAGRSGKPPLKARLLDQHRLAGLGNLLVDEILWRAGLAPTRWSGSLSPAELRRLHRHLRATLQELGARGGSHTGDLMAARRSGGVCPNDGTALRHATVGGRSTWWCPAHQV